MHFIGSENLLLSPNSLSVFIDVTHKHKQ